MLHYYDDEGNLQFDLNRQLLVELFEVLPDAESDSAQRQEIADLAATVEHDYEIHKTMGGLGGCLSVDEWRRTDEETPVKTVLKRMLFDFIDRGFIPREFCLVTRSTICEIQLAKHGF